MIQMTQADFVVILELNDFPIALAENYKRESVAEYPNDKI